MMKSAPNKGPLVAKVANSRSVFKLVCSARPYKPLPSIHSRSPVANTQKPGAAAHTSLKSRQHSLFRCPSSANNNSTPQTSFNLLDFSSPALVTLVSTLLTAPAALAADAIAYNPQEGSETLKTVAGVGYIILVIVYFIRLFRKRASKATSERIASTDKEEEEEDNEEDLAAVGAASSNSAIIEDNVTPLQCLIGFAQAGVICYLLYLLSTSVDGFFAKQNLPTQYTARNIAILVQTVVRGLAYLATFIFGANAVGLASLGLAMVVAPDWVKEGGRPRGEKKEKLPDVKLTDDIFTLRRAFEEAERMGRQKAEKENEN